MFPDCWLNGIPLFKDNNMSWHKITLTKEQVARGKISEVQHIFFDFILSMAGELNTSQLTMLSGRSGSNEYIIYLSPNCLAVPELKTLISAYEGKPCAIPSSGSISFLAGDSVFAQQFIRYER